MLPHELALHTLISILLSYPSRKSLQDISKDAPLDPTSCATGFSGKAMLKAWPKHHLDISGDL